jgi:hypothetical protein
MVNYSGLNASAVLFLQQSADKKTLHSMLIVNGKANNYMNISVQTIWQAMFKLLSIYYVFDRNYPATYGLLLLLDRYCVSPKGTPAAARGARKGDPLNFRKFVNGFEQFLIDSAESE